MLLLLWVVSTRLSYLMFVVYHGHTFNVRFAVSKDAGASASTETGVHPPLRLLHECCSGTFQCGRHSCVSRHRRNCTFRVCSTKYRWCLFRVAANIMCLSRASRPLWRAKNQSSTRSGKRSGASSSSSIRIVCVSVHGLLLVSFQELQSALRGSIRSSPSHDPAVDSCMLLLSVSSGVSACWRFGTACSCWPSTRVSTFSVCRKRLKVGPHVGKHMLCTMCPDNSEQCFNATLLRQFSWPTHLDCGLSQSALPPASVHTDTVPRSSFLPPRASLAKEKYASAAPSHPRIRDDWSPSPPSSVMHVFESCNLSKRTAVRSATILVRVEK